MPYRLTMGAHQGLPMFRRDGGIQGYLDTHYI